MIAASHIRDTARPHMCMHLTAPRGRSRQQAAVVRFQMRMPLKSAMQMQLHVAQWEGWQESFIFTGCSEALSYSHFPIKWK